MITRLSLAAFLTATSALAAAQGTPAAEKSVTRSELSAKLDAGYASLDTNKDGKAGSAEVETRLKAAVASEMNAYKKERDQTFASFDTDSNGSISRAEFDARAKLPTAPAVNTLQ